MKHVHDLFTDRCALVIGLLLIIGVWPAWGSETSGTAPLKSEAPWKRFDAERAFGYLKKQVAFGSRVPGSPAHKQCLDWMEDFFRKMGYKTRKQTFPGRPFLMGGKTIEGVNLFAYRENPSTPTVRLALSAHWDCRPYADSDPNRRSRSLPVPGANDAASGVAVLMELARLFQTQPPPADFVFVLFDQEDGGQRYSDVGWCLGSRHAAENWPNDLPIDWGINLDMIGDRNLRIRVDPTSFQKARAQTLKIWRVGMLRYPEHFSQTFWSEILDDHIPFLDRGIPYVNLIDFEYDAWHTVLDTPDQCSAESLRVVGEVVAEVVYREGGPPESVKPSTEGTP